MGLSVLDLFSIGTGPSSSHTVGPMRAATRFLAELDRLGVFDSVVRVQAELFGSLALTGRGHGSDKAVILGLAGELPESVDAALADDLVTQVRQHEQLVLGGRRRIRFVADDLAMHLGVFLPGHPKGMRFTARDGRGRELCRKDYFSIGGGFVVDEEAVSQDRPLDGHEDSPIDHDFTSGKELVEQAERHGLRVSELALRPYRGRASSPASWRSAASWSACCADTVGATWRPPLGQVPVSPWTRAPGMSVRTGLAQDPAVSDPATMMAARTNGSKPCWHRCAPSRRARTPLLPGGAWSVTSIPASGASTRHATGPSAWRPS